MSHVDKKIEVAEEIATRMGHSTLARKCVEVQS